MKNLLIGLAALGGTGGLVKVGRTMIASYRAKKSIGNIMADTAEVILDEIDPKADNAK